MSGIVVGVDGSQESGRALGWAMHEATLRHVPLTVMTVHPSPVRPATGIFWALHTLPEGGLSQEQTRQAVQDFVEKVASEIGSTVPEVTVSVAYGSTAEELVSASRDADLLVVGSRGNGEFARLLMGSVSSQVARHADCPVAVSAGPAEPRRSAISARRRAPGLLDESPAGLRRAVADWAGNHPLCGVYPYF